MYVINARNVNEAFDLGFSYVRSAGIPEETRNGPAWVCPMPVTTVYAKPRERVLFSTKRDANPFFHLFEALWMLAGRKDLQVPMHMVNRFENFSDDGTTLHGAYGWRWRNHFPNDQIEQVVRILSANRNSRRAYISMFDPACDFINSKDIPCNVGIHFRVSSCNLDMTVFNRSNDAVMGAHGANAVHMSILQEYIANRLGLRVGTYYQVSDNYHIYEADFDKFQNCDFIDFYVGKRAVCYPTVVNDNGSFINEVNVLLSYMVNQQVIGSYEFKNGFLADIAAPMMNAYIAYKAGEKAHVNKFINVAPSGIDWIVAAKMWFHRRGVEGLSNVPS